VSATPVDPITDFFWIGLARVAEIDQDAAATA
jgi:hypothetical protein